MTEEKIDTPTGEENRADTPESQDGVVFDEGQDKEEQPQEEKEKKEATTEINQDNVNKKINRLTFQWREEERKREALERKNRELEAKLKSPILDGKPPQPPDPYDEDYQTKMVKWQQDVQKYAEVQGEEKYRQKIERQKTMEELNSRVKTMYEKADKYGIKSYELKDAELKVSDVLASMPGTKADIANFLLKHDESPLIIKHLANSAEDLYRLKDMDTATAAVYIDNVVAKKAQALKPQVSSAPKPMDIPEGKGPGEKKNKYLEGVVFE